MRSLVREAVAAGVGRLAAERTVGLGQEAPPQALGQEAAAVAGLAVLDEDDDEDLSDDEELEDDEDESEEDDDVEAEVFDESLDDEESDEDLSPAERESVR